MRRRTHAGAAAGDRRRPRRLPGDHPGRRDLAADAAVTTSSPTPRAQSLPTTVPVGHGDVGPQDVVWAQGSTLHVGAHQWDLAPLRVESFAVVPGGVFFLSGAELWFTDLVKARATGVTGATRLVTTANGSAVRVTAGNPPTTPRLGRHDRPHGAGWPGTPDPPITSRRGPGSFSLLGSDGDPLRVHRVGAQHPLRLAGVVGDGFRLVRWTSGTRFYGLALAGGAPRSSSAATSRPTPARRAAGSRRTIPWSSRAAAERGRASPGSPGPAARVLRWLPSTPSSLGRSSTREAIPRSRSRCSSTTTRSAVPPYPPGRPRAPSRRSSCATGRSGTAGRAPRRPSPRCRTRSSRRSSGSTPATSASSTRPCSTSTAPPTRPTSAPTPSSASPSRWRARRR